MLTYSAIALLAVLAEAVSGSPIEKRFTNSVIRSGRNDQCLSLPAGATPVNGAGLVTRDCNTASRWDINPGAGSVVLSGTNFALDAGVPQGNNMYAKIWQSFPGSTQQTWYLTADNRIAVAGGNQCLDQGDNGPQTYQCTNGNTNQGQSNALYATMHMLIISLVGRRIGPASVILCGLLVGFRFVLQECKPFSVIRTTPSSHRTTAQIWGEPKPMCHRPKRLGR